MNGAGFVSIEEAFEGVYSVSRAYFRDVVFQVPEFLEALIELFPDLDTSQTTLIRS